MNDDQTKEGLEELVSSANDAEHVMTPEEEALAVAALTSALKVTKELPPSRRNAPTDDESGTVMVRVGDRPFTLVVVPEEGGE